MPITRHTGQHRHDTGSNQHRRARTVIQVHIDTDTPISRELELAIGTALDSLGLLVMSLSVSTVLELDIEDSELSEWLPSSERGEIKRKGNNYGLEVTDTGNNVYLSPSYVGEGTRRIRVMFYPNTDTVSKVFAQRYESDYTENNGWFTEGVRQEYETENYAYVMEKLERIAAQPTQKG